MESLPDLATLSDEDLKRLIDELEQEENEVSFRRRMLQGKIDILRAERTARLKGKGVTDVDVERLTDILASRSDAPERRGRVSHVYCAECGFQNPEASNYCARCGARLEKGEAGEQTMTYTPGRASETTRAR